MEEWKAMARSTGLHCSWFPKQPTKASSLGKQGRVQGKEGTGNTRVGLDFMTNLFLRFWMQKVSVTLLCTKDHFVQFPLTKEKGPQWVLAWMKNVRDVFILLQIKVERK